ncbi:MAG: cation:proton antiporter [Deltaproteobacteria bacterium]|nr:cation:proton antiporter [Deltaproteobacteria bacterium]
METLPLLRDMIILFGVSLLISIALVRIGLPTIVGFLLTGVIIGPYGGGIVTEIKTVETLARIGIVLLLFTIGLEFSVKRMVEIGRKSAVGGALQIVLTVFSVWLFLSLAGHSPSAALLMGFIVSLSSSAIVLKLLTDRGEIQSFHGNLSVGILLFQDISVVLMVMVIQSIGGGAAVTGPSLAKGLIVALISIFLIVAAVVYLVPRLFHEVVKLRNREVFMLTIVFTCMGTAWITSFFGLSLALGAFIAGLAISESEYSHQIVAEVLPFRDTLSALFFISIGMLVELNYLLSHLPEILLFTAAVVFIKTMVLVSAGGLLGYPRRVSIMVGLNLAQVGEFSFILIKMGEGYGIFSHELYQTTLAVSILTMATTPFIFRWSSPVASFAGGRGFKEALAEKARLLNHVIIVGYGLNGRNLARVLKETGIEHLVMDMNAERTKTARKDGHPAYFADAGHPEVLKKMAVEDAKMIVVGITDPVGTRRIVKGARDLNPAITIIVRTRYLNEVEELYRLGASEVIPEEFETSVEIFARVLKDYRLPGNIIQNEIDLVRHEGYAMFRNPSLSGERLARLTSILETSVMDTYFVEKGSNVEGKTIEGLDIVKRTGGGVVMAVIRKGKAHTNPKGDFRIEAQDMLVLLGSHAELNSAMKILKEKCPEGELEG